MNARERQVAALVAEQEWDAWERGRERQVDAFEECGWQIVGVGWALIVDQVTNEPMRRPSNFEISWHRDGAERVVDHCNLQPGQVLYIEGERVWDALPF